MRRLKIGLALSGLTLATAGLPTVARAAENRPGLQPCWLDGVAQQVWCGVVPRPIDPAQPRGALIEVHFAVLPALARNRLPDPVFFLAGGPGQSAIDLAGSIGQLLSRLNNRRDLVLVDQRGTGRSAPLACPQPPLTAPMAQAAGPVAQLARLQRCREQLQKLPYGDLRQYTTPIATADLDAVRQQLGAERINLIGGSYGTRAVLEIMRQFPRTVRRAVIDGVAPPDMVLPAAASLDNQGALDAVFDACRAEPACQVRHPALKAAWQALLARLPQDVRVRHPVTGTEEALNVSRELLLGLVRAPLYTPALTRALPQAISEAVAGRFGPLLALSSAGAPRQRGQIAEGMHFSVICSEDVDPSPGSATSPDPAPDTRTPAAGQRSSPSGARRIPAVARYSIPPQAGADFRDSFASAYAQVCASWPKAALPAGYRKIPPASAATLVLSGGADPVTPPRHAERVVQALGPLARHVVVIQAGHGLLALPCLRDVVYRFIDAETDAEALKVDTGCAAGVPRPPAFVPLAVLAADPPASGSRR